MVWVYGRNVKYDGAYAYWLFELVTCDLPYKPTLNNLAMAQGSQTSSPEVLNIPTTECIV